MSQLVTGLDHIVLVAPEIDSAAAVYEALLGRPPSGARTGRAGPRRRSSASPIPVSN
ncbi:hypothetical protein [Hyphomonas adhaerens]|uniref:hypothetical protein n=1 Tax=Hyphomonas adhaerens TaxID=81029 RepID=UPI00235595B0|nr:hypothetical protein [Hyphomonas adhaerens]